jgi:hypothetical protein
MEWGAVPPLGSLPCQIVGALFLQLSFDTAQIFQGGSMPTQSRQPPERPRRALRLTFEYNGTNVRLASKRQIDTMAPPSDRTDEYKGHAGFWVELRDADGRILYRRIMHNPIEVDREAPSGDPKRPFTRVRNEQKQGVFTVMVPDLDHALEVSLVGSPPEQPARAAKQLLRVNLKEQPQGRPADKQKDRRRKPETK